jgi:hypothetical protein
VHFQSTTFLGGPGKRANGELNPGYALGAYKRSACPCRPQQPCCRSAAYPEHVQLQVEGMPSRLQSSD